jgi:hypothetical protein
MRKKKKVGKGWVGIYYCAARSFKLISYLQGYLYYIGICEIVYTVVEEFVVTM